MNWINIKDKLPSEREKVWIYDQYHGVAVGSFSSGWWMSADEYADPDELPTILHKVTHWMPLIVPEPPKVKEDE